MNTEEEWSVLLNVIAPYTKNITITATLPFFRRVNIASRNLVVSLADNTRVTDRWETSEAPSRPRIPKERVAGMARMIKKIPSRK